MDASRPEQLRLVLAEIIRSWNLKSGKVVLVLPSHSAFTRAVPLNVPGGDAGNVDAVVRFEAHQNIPFPLEEVVWDYAIMGTLPSGAINVVFLAVKTDLLNSLCEAITRNGLDVAMVTVSPLALHDALRRQGLPPASEPPLLLLDTGSKTTNLVIAGTSSFFSRSIPSGGLAVTSAISREIHATLEEAERLKTTRGSVGLGPGFAAPQDPLEANLARISRQTLIKTQADIGRSLAYYRSNLSGMDPVAILLAGGMSSMPYFAEFIQEKLQKPTSFFNPLKGVDVTPKAAIFTESHPHNVGELVGGAAGYFSPDGASVKLLPPAISRRQEFSKRLPWLAGAATLLLLTLGVWWLYAAWATRATLEESGKLELEIQSDTRIAVQIADLLQAQKKAREAGSSLLSLMLAREAYPGLLAELAAKLPERYLWITEVQPASDASSKSGKQPGTGAANASNTTPSPVTAVIVKGLYLDNPRQALVIDDFVNSLQSSSIFAIEQNDKPKIITQRGSPNGEFWAYPFSLRIPLRHPITPLP
jgi:type IV pilus assembly protein PilM